MEQQKIDIAASPPVEPFTLNLENIPEALKALPQWVGWKREEVGGKCRKPPCNLNGKRINPIAPDNWTDFAEAAAAIEEAELLEENILDGIGFSIADSDPFTCIDIDHCLNAEGVPDSFTRGIIERFNSYTEISPGGDGVHIWIKGKWSGSPKPKIDGRQLEIYSENRYMTVTGIVLRTGEVEPRQEALDALLDKVGGALPPPVENKAQPLFTPPKGSDWRAIQLDPAPLTPGDVKLIETIKSSKQGAEFAALMDGADSRISADPSSADQALCNILAFWCKGDTGQIDRIWKASVSGGREKWQREDYRRRTIAEAFPNDVYKKQVSTGGDDEWGEPLPICQENEPEPYPIDSFPDGMKAAIEEVQEYRQAPRSLTGQSALAALSIACQGHINTLRSRTLLSPVSLFTLTVADSGDRKTSCDNLFVAPIEAHQRELQAEYQEKWEKYNADIEGWETERQGVKASIKNLARGGEDTTAEKERLLDLEKRKPERPLSPAILLSDETPENLLFRLYRDWPSVALASSEAATVLSGRGMSKESLGSYISSLNSLWGGETLSVGRKGSGSFTLRQARLTVSLMVQEAPLKEFFEKARGYGRGSGFLARFLICKPVSIQGERIFRQEPVGWPRLEQFHRQLTAIMDVPLVFDENNHLDFTTMKILSEKNPEAHKVWEGFYNSVETEQKKGGRYFEVRDFASKAAENAARIAALFQLFEDGTPYGRTEHAGDINGYISAENMRRGATLSRWYLEEALRFFVEMERTPEEEDAIELEKWLIERYKQGIHREKEREANRNLFGRKLPRLRGAISFLAERNRLRVTPKGKSTLVEINPQILRDIE